jgi:hypothetical protein
MQTREFRKIYVTDGISLVRYEPFLSKDVKIIYFYLSQVRTISVSETAGYVEVTP